MRIVQLRALTKIMLAQILPDAAEPNEWSQDPTP